MTIRLTWYGHSAFRVDVGGHRILIDPFLTGSALAPISADDIDADYILITHGHGDHVGDASASPSELAHWSSPTSRSAIGCRPKV